MINPILYLLAFSLCSCSNSQKLTEAPAKATKHQNDTIEYKAITNVFYLGSDGKTYIKTRTLIHPPEEYGPDFYREVPVSDPESYTEFTGGFYSKDKYNVYRYRGTTDGKFIDVVEEADVKTFSVISFQLGKDQNHVFYRGKIVEGIDVNALKTLCDNPNINFLSSYGLIKDDKNVYYQGSKIETVDVASFECICEDSTIIYRDKNWIHDDDYFPGMDPDKRTKRE